MPPSCSGLWVHNHPVLVYSVDFFRQQSGNTGTSTVSKATTVTGRGPVIGHTTSSTSGNTSQSDSEGSTVVWR